MMPWVVSGRFRDGRGRWHRLWIPVLPVVLLLSPLLLLALLVAVPVCLVHRVNPVRALVGCVALVAALAGTDIDIDQDGTALVLRIR
jgi:hypothetical protein